MHAVTTGTQKVLLDSGASDHLFGTLSLITDRVRCAPRVVKGANGISTIDWKGKFKLADATVHYMPGAPNLLSAAKMRARWKMTLLKDGDVFLLREKRGDKTLVFALHDGLYPLAYALEKEDKVIFEESDVTKGFGGLEALKNRIKDHDLRKEISALAASAGRDRSKSTTARATAMARLVRLPAMQHTKEEVKKALLARQLERIFLTSSGNIKKLLRGGHLKNCFVTEKDLDRAEEIWGRNSDNLLTNPYKPDGVPAEAKAARSVERGELKQKAYVDLLFLWTKPQLQVHIKPLGMTFSIEVANRSEGELTKALNEAVDRIRAAGFEIDQIRIDGEKAVLSRGCIHSLASLGVAVIPSTRDDHVVEIERQNRTTRCRVVQVLLSLMYRGPLSWMKYVCMHANAMSSSLPLSGDKPGDATPAEKFYGRVFDMRDFIPFGEYVLCKTPESARTDKGYYRDEGIFLGRDWGAFDMAHVYCFRSREVRPRKHSWLTPLPMPEHAIEVINEIADREMRVAGMHIEKLQFDDKIFKDDRMTLDDKVREIMTENLFALYEKRSAARAYLKTPDDDDDGGESGGTSPVIETSDEDQDDVEHPNDMDDCDGPFRDDRVDRRATRTYIARRRGDEHEDHAEDDEAESSFVYDVTEPSKALDMLAGYTSVVEDSTAPSRYTTARGVFDWNESPPNVGADRQRTPLHGIETPGPQTPPPEDETVHAKAKEKFDAIMSFYAVTRTRNYGMISACNISVKEAFKSYPNEAYGSTYSELEKVLERTFVPVDWRRLGRLEKTSAIACMLFLKAKFHPNTGDFIKLKSRLVACQVKKRATAEDTAFTSSPTVSMSAFLTLLTVATKRDYYMGTGDVPNAYLHAKTNPKLKTVHAIFDRSTTKIALEVKPELQALVDEKGRLWGRLDYSLYGLLQSGLNWYKHISETLRNMGMTASNADPCLWSGRIDGEDIIIALYVDDVIAAAQSLDTVKKFYRKLDETYAGIYDSMCCGAVLTYLGTSIDRSSKGVTYVHQPEFVKQLLADWKRDHDNDLRMRRSPAPADLLSVDEDSPPLEPKDMAYYRSMLMRTAFLINTTRFDLKVALMYLSRRMHCATEQDMKRLAHLIGYIAFTAEYGLTINPGTGELHVYAYTDASHATMHDMRSVTGGVICIGDGGATVFAKSSKQSIVAKSSMECEYIACSDIASQVIHIRNLLISLGIPQPAAKIYVDNNSAIHVVRNGRPTAQLTRHIRVREAWVSERQDNDEIDVEHISTKLEVADCLTKPLTGTLLHTMTEWLLGWVAHPGPESSRAKERERKGARK